MANSWQMSSNGKQVPEIKQSKAKAKQCNAQQAKAEAKALAKARQAKISA